MRHKVDLEAEKIEEIRRKGRVAGLTAEEIDIAVLYHLKSTGSPLYKEYLKKVDPEAYEEEILEEAEERLAILRGEKTDVVIKKAPNLEHLPTYKEAKSVQRREKLKLFLILLAEAVVVFVLVKIT